MKVKYIDNSGSADWYEDETFNTWGVSDCGKILDIDGLPMSDEWLIREENQELIEALHKHQTIYFNK